MSRRASRALPVGAGARYALVVLFAINLMNFFDRQIIGGVGEGIRREWGLSDTALGLLGTVFTLLYAVVGLPLGRLADRPSARRHPVRRRVRLEPAHRAVGPGPQLLGQLFVARLGVGVGEATCSPASTSLLGDLFPPSLRARAIAIWMLGLPLGLGLANGAGGWLLQNWGWRNAFYVAAVPGLVCAVAALFIREPARGMAEAHAIGSAGAQARRIDSCSRSRRCGGSSRRARCTTSTCTRSASFSRRSSSASTSMSFADAGWLAAVVYGFSGIVGLVGGGALADRLYRRRVDGRLLVGDRRDRRSARR